MDTTGDYAWIMASTALVFMMVPGIALFYSGLRSQTTALSLIWLSMMAVSVVSIQWFLFGYSLVFSQTSTSGFIGNFHYALFLNVDKDDAFAGIRAHNTPAMVFGLFQGMFAAFTIALVTGVVAEKGRLFPFLIFSFFWTSLVYDPIAYWLWNEQGWGNSMGGLDWAGGTPVHICSGAATLAYTVMLKYIRVTTDDTHSITSISHDAGSWKKYLFSRAQRRERLPSGPTALEAGLESHNMTNAMLGMLLVWFGWFGFNAGSELKANMRAVSTFIATNIAACSGGVAYTLLERMAGQKWSGLGFCTGAFAGLVAITPGAGYVPPWAALIFGSTAAAVVFGFEAIKWLEDFLEEPLHITIIHGVGGLWGMFLTGIFADKRIAKLDDSDIPGGAINGHGKQIRIQLAGGFGGFFYSFFATLGLLIIMQFLSIYFPSLELRARSRRGALVNLDEEELEDTGAYRLTCHYHPLTADPYSSRPGSALPQSGRPSLSPSLQNQPHSHRHHPQHQQYIEMDGHSPTSFSHSQHHGMSPQNTRTKSDVGYPARIGQVAYDSGGSRGSGSR
ncbi:Rh-like protein/ammonium transporter [Cadophora sp. DSE1049]|nr:Rh-like protein/ammonium transporter [Cadophora sp. DSE1049]